MRPFPHPVAEGHTVISVNEIADVKAFAHRDDFIIMGGGKTGMDACGHLMSEGVDPKHIRWIVPNDPYIIDRDGAF